MEEVIKKKCEKVLMLKRLKNRFKILGKLSMVRTNIQGKSLKAVRKTVGTHLLAKKQWITSSAYSNFETIVEHGQRSSLKLLNNMLDTLKGQPSGTKLPTNSLKDFGNQKGLTVVVDNLERPRTTAYFKLRGKVAVYDEAFDLARAGLETKLTKILKHKTAMKVLLGIKVAFIKRGFYGEGGAHH